MATRKKAQPSEEQLALTKAKANYATTVKAIKFKFKFKGATLEEQAKIYTKATDEQKQEIRRWLNNEQMIRLCQLVYAKALSMRAYAQEGSYLSMSSMRITGQHYRVDCLPAKGLTLRLTGDLSSKPSDEQILQAVQRYFPSVQMVH